MTIRQLPPPHHSQFVVYSGRHPTTPGFRSARLRYWRYGAVTWLLTACASIPARTYPAPEPVTVAASFDRTWSAVVDHFAEKSVPIKTIEKASGLIVTEPMVVSQGYGRTIADCGQAFEGVPWDVSRASYNVRVVGDSAQTTIRVTAMFVPESEHATCNSRGVYERELMSFVKARAEKR